jgi:hypothetical protein
MPTVSKSLYCYTFRREGEDVVPYLKIYERYGPYTKYGEAFWEESLIRVSDYISLISVRKDMAKGKEDWTQSDRDTYGSLGYHLKRYL